MRTFPVNQLTQIIWDPPYTLNLTDIEPDVVYCVDIFNITCGSQWIHLYSDCLVFQPKYTLHHRENSTSLKFPHKIIVTPRSNVEEAQNGTSAVYIRKSIIMYYH